MPEPRESNFGKQLEKHILKNGARPAITPDNFREAQRAYADFRTRGFSKNGVAQRRYIAFGNYMDTIMEPEDPSSVEARNMFLEDTGRGQNKKLNRRAKAPKFTPDRRFY